MDIAILETMVEDTIKNGILVQITMEVKIKEIIINGNMNGTQILVQEETKKIMITIIRKKFNGILIGEIIQTQIKIIKMMVGVMNGEQIPIIITRKTMVGIMSGELTQIVTKKKMIKLQIMVMKKKNLLLLQELNSKKLL